MCWYRGGRRPLLAGIPEARFKNARRGGSGMAIAGLTESGVVDLGLLLIATGALSGFLAGLFGIGGGAVLVPVFYECFRLAGVPLEVRVAVCVRTPHRVSISDSSH